MVVNSHPVLASAQYVTLLNYQSHALISLFSISFFVEKKKVAASYSCEIKWEYIENVQDRAVELEVLSVC